MSARAPIIPCPECGARHGDQCTYAKCPRKSFTKRASAPYLRAARGVAPLPSPVSSGTLSVVDGFPLASTSRVRGHHTLRTSKARRRRLYGVFRSQDTRISPIPLGPFSFVPRLRQHALNSITELFQTTVPPGHFFKARSVSKCANTLSVSDKSYST